MIIGFDFDKVFINYPPFIPDSLVDLIYKGKIFKKNKTNYVNLSYRFPGTIEKRIRIFSHRPYFRHPIESNINALKTISKTKDVKTYLVSSRYEFLKARTEEILKKYKLKQYFSGVYFNFENKQPHQFKEETIKKLKIQKYIDDDLDLALYLARKLPSLTIYWIKNKDGKKVSFPQNVIPITDINEFLAKYL